MSPTYEERVLEGYLRCALWTSSNAKGVALDKIYTTSRFTSKAQEEALATIVAFIKEVAPDSLYDLLMEDNQSPFRLGINLWLTRNGHGAGFWDGDWPVNGRKLTAAAKKLGESYVEEHRTGRLGLLTSR